MDNIFCTNCGSKVSSTSKFCEECGKELIVEKSKINSNFPLKTAISKLIPSPIKRYFNGEISLVKSYWLIAIPSGIIFRVFQESSTEMIWIGIGVLISIYISIGLWRSAVNYQKNLKIGERKYWGSIVQMLIIINIIGLFW